MKKTLVCILILSILLVSCTGNKEAQIIKKMEKVLNNYIGYETVAEVKIVMDNKETLYKLKEIYLNPEKISLEILEPEENNGVIIEYRGEAILLNNTSINQSISLKNIKGLNEGLLFGEFFRDRSSIKSVQEETLDGINCYAINYTPEDSNKYNKEKIIYLNRKNFIPYQMVTMDEDNNERVIIKYENFKFNKN